MDNTRRRFLRHSLVVLGSVAGGAAARQLRSQPAPSSGPASPPPANGPTVPVLTPDHQVMHAQCCPGGGPTVQQVVHHHGIATNAREGVPNRRWVMVIDLAKCDGCGKCTDGLLQDAFRPAGPAVDQGPADAGREAHRPLLLPAALLPLRQPALHQGLPGGRDVQAAGRNRADRQRALHRLPVLHGRLPVRRAELQLGPAPAIRPRRGAGVLAGARIPAPRRHGGEMRLLRRTWPRRTAARHAPPAARWARSTTATRTKTPSPTPRARRSGSPNCCKTAPAIATWRSLAPSRGSITCRRRAAHFRRPRALTPVVATRREDRHDTTTDLTVRRQSPCVSRSRRGRTSVAT